MKNKELIGYNFKDEKYVEFFQKLVPAYRRKVHTSEGIDLRVGCGAYNIAKETGVLDIWFEPVYEDTFQVGDYVIRTISSGGVHNKGRVFKIIEIREDGALREDSTIFHKKENCRKATKDEIESQLTKEAKKKGFKEGVLVDNSKLESIKWEQDEYPIHNNVFSYNSEDDRLKLGQKFIYEKGIWAEVVEKEEFEVGDLVVVLPEDEFYWNAHGGDVAKIINIGGDNLPYSLKFDDGDINSYAKIRKATKEEIEKSKSPKLPKINGYTGEDAGEDLKYGCAYLPKEWFKGGANRTITEITLNTGVKINEKELKQIRTYLNSKQND